MCRVWDTSVIMAIYIFFLRYFMFLTMFLELVNCEGGLSENCGDHYNRIDETRNDQIAFKLDFAMTFKYHTSGELNTKFQAETNASQTLQVPDDGYPATNSYQETQNEKMAEAPIQEEQKQEERNESQTPAGKDNGYWVSPQKEVEKSKTPTQVEQKQIPHATNNIKIDKLIIPPLPWSQLYATVAQPKMDKIADEFHDFREKWRALLVSDIYDETNAALVKYTKTLSKQAESLYETLNKCPNRTYLWPIGQEDTLSADLIVTHFQRLQKLSLAYGTNGTLYYKNPIILSAVKDGLDFMVAPGKYDGEKYRGNWWFWQVGVPTNFINILMVIKYELPLGKIQQYTKVMSCYVPDPYHRWWSTPQETFVEVASAPSYGPSIATRSELARTILGLGILQNDTAKISLSVASIVEIFKPVTKGDGFYQDGSFINHQDLPYTGTSGNVLLYRLGEILAITKGSKYEMAPDLVQSLIESVERAFLPLIYRGEMIATVTRLAISRPSSTMKLGYGSITMYNLLMIAKSATDKDTKKIKESVKYWVQQNPDFYLSNARIYNDLLIAIALLNDSSIIGDMLPFVGTKMYASMDRFVQRTSNYMLGVSLYSKRISAFMAGNNENKRGWHTADGALYLYNGDDVQFCNAYWPTVDPYRLPGTTVDTRHLDDEVSDNRKFTSDEKWVGGVASFNQGVVGMSLNKSGFQNNGQTLSMDLKGKKSWFVVDGQIVALGAGITGTTDASIETIIDNRLLNDQYTYDVATNHGDIKATMERIKIDWLLLKSDHKHSSIGYYFPNRENVTVISETRIRTNNDINGISPSNDTYTGNYRKFIINHGQSPVDAKYAYVILPGIKMCELIEYSNRKPVTILQNSADIQAVEITNQGYLGINFWSEIGGEIGGIGSNKPVSLMRQTKDHEQTYVLSDPTQSNNVVKIRIPDFSKVVTMSKGIYYDVKSNEFVVNFTNAGGASKQFTVNKIE